VKNFRTDCKDWLRDEIFAMSRKQWQVVKHLLTNHEWDFFHYVDIAGQTRPLVQPRQRLGSTIATR
jgi:hypothetical protein